MDPAAIYDRLWRESLPALRRNQVQPEPLPVMGAPRWGVSALLRVDPSSSTARRLAAAAARVGRVAGVHHVVYGPELLHTTVRSIEGFRGSVASDDEAIERYARVLEEEAGGQGTLGITYAGVVPTLGGVLAQGLAVDEALESLRARLHLRLADEACVPGPETRSPRDLDHASLMLFTGPLHDPPATVAAIEGDRATEFGVAVFDHIELVRHERTHRGARIVPLRRIALRG